MLRKILLSIFSLWLFWVLLSTSFEISHIIIGLIISIIVNWLCYCFISYVFFEEIIFRISGVRQCFLLIVYLFSTIQNMITANIDVAERVLDPELPINPSIVKIKAPFKNNTFLFAFLANTITLTPGTLALDYEDDYLYIHFLAEEYIESITGRHLEKKILQIFDINKN